MLGRVRIRDAAFRVIRTSRNLRGILDYSRGRGVERIDLYRNKVGGGGQLGLAWNTGATCIVDFASFDVMVQWVQARRVFAGAPVIKHYPEGADHE